MREVLGELVGWWRAGRPAALATVVRTWRSAPRPAGAAMLVGPDGSAVGSVSGGCVEAAVHQAGAAVLDGAPAGIERYGVSDDDAFAVGLTCGGVLDVFVERVDPSTFPELGELVDAVEAGQPIALVTVIEGGPDQVGRHLLVGTDGSSGSLGSVRLDAAAVDDVRGQLAAGHTGTLRYGPDGERRGDGLTLLVVSFAPAPRLLIFGAIDFAAAVARQGTLLGYHVTVCDAREVFATRQRFPDADQVVVDWPHRYLQQQVAAGAIDHRTAICVLTHDPKFDVPLLATALRLDGAQRPAFVGAMGSRRTHDDRWRRLQELGLTTDELSRLASPIGLDLGARTPEETAVSIAAEIIARRWQASGRPLSERSGAIHHDPLVTDGDPTPLRGTVGSER